jgi:hypothetical protein
LAAGHRDIAQAHLTAALERFTTLNDQSGMTRAEQAITRLQPTTPSP